jgi:hypothetical protein
MGVIIDEQIIDAREVATSSRRSPSPTESSSSKNRSSIFNKSSLNSPPSWLGSSFTSIKNSTTSAIRSASSVASSVASSIIPSTPEKSTSSRSTTKPPRRFSQEQGVPLTDQSKASFEELPDNLTDSVEALDISNKIVNNNLDPFGIQEASTISTKPAELKSKSSSRNRMSESGVIMTSMPNPNTNTKTNTTKNNDPNDSLPGEIRSSFLDELIGKL